MILEEGTQHAQTASLDERLACARKAMSAVLGIVSEVLIYEKAGGPSQAEERQKKDDVVAHVHAAWLAPCKPHKQHVCAGGCGRTGNRWKAKKLPNP